MLSVLQALLPALVLATWAISTKADDKEPPKTSVRTLEGDDAKQVEALTKTIDQLKGAGKFAEAVEPAKQIAAICEKALGANHWQTSDAGRTVQDLRKIASLPEEGRKAMASAEELFQRAYEQRERGNYSEVVRINREWLAIHRKWLGDEHADTAEAYNNLAYGLDAQGKSAEAEPLYRKALAIKLKVLGENHPDVATSYGNLAYNLDAQGNWVEAEPLHGRALAIQLRFVGEDHPDIAVCYSNVGGNLDAQGKLPEAEHVHRKALAIFFRALGEDHPLTALVSNNLASNLDSQGRHAEAEPFHRKSLAVFLQTRGEDHPETALSYNNLATNLHQQGKYSEAELFFRKALAIRLRTLGEDHPLTATSYDNAGSNLVAQRKWMEAEPLRRKALAIFLNRLGENHPSTAQSYTNLAYNLEGQQKSLEAEPLLRKAMAIAIKVPGEAHPLTASIANHVAHNLERQGKPAAAESLYRKVLAIRLKVFGENHPDTANSYNSLASNLDAQGKLDDALPNWSTAAEIQERVRGARSASGLERSLTADSSPLSLLAAGLARKGRPRDAWTRWEADLARGLLDDLSARQLRPLTPDQRRREAALAGQLQKLGERITRLAAKAKRTQDEDKRLDVLRNQQSTQRGQWVEFQNTVDRQYRAYAGKPSTLEEVQKTIPAVAALVGWLDIKKHHWACVVRHEDEPVWVQVPGTGRDGAWTEEDDERPGRLRDALTGHQTAWRALAEALARQRLGPLLPHLKGVKHLIVLPSRELAGVPIETLVASSQRSGDAGIVVSYAPSGSMLARLSAPRSHAPGPIRLLAVGDPAFPKPAQIARAPIPPDYGIALLKVEANSTAGLFGIKIGDVLLEYNGKVLRTSSDLVVVPAGDKAVHVPVKLWRDGEVRSIEIAAGELGILPSSPDRPAAQVVLAQRAAAEVLHPGVRGERLSPLPGTRREVQAIAALFPDGQATTLLSAEATESNVQRLAQSGELKSYRFIHLATHGKANLSVALSSAVFLAAEPERPATSPADPASLESAPDGQITAEQIVRSWELDADLVTLSACQSGLGRYAGGEGYLGFAQALFVKGARSLLLSLWKVDDEATALLMERFYQNLLGRRPGLKAPLPKVEALDQAKAWLRGLTVAERDGLRHRDPGRARGPVEDLPPLLEGTDAAKSVEGDAAHPFAHPYYWAAFILVGDPR